MYGRVKYQTALNSSRSSLKRADEIPPARYFTYPTSSPHLRPTNSPHFTPLLLTPHSRRQLLLPCIRVYLPTVDDSFSPSPLRSSAGSPTPQSPLNLVEMIDLDTFDDDDERVIFIIRLVFVFVFFWLRLQPSSRRIVHPFQDAVMKEMLNTSGFGYDPINKCIEVDPQKYPNKKKYRGPKLWRYCDEFAEVYGEFLATGKDAVTLNNILHDDTKPLPSTPASQTTPLYMQPDSEQSFTQMLNDDSPLQSPVPPTPTTENSTNNTTTRRSKRNRSNSSNDDVYYNLLNSIAQNMDTLAHTCRGFQYVKCCKILQEMVDSGLLDSHTRLMSMDLLAEGTNSMIFVNIPPSDRVTWLSRRLADS